ncbi:phosphoribosylformylglycinamidine cyclo-ligase [Candidatus Entotheonella palauensis]|uniref:phosphoribosylformylglycinamidine cyclo-ligase n=1 Tax=Candidatus Entotheonella palauensis TaxID=93172 RepID=UPI000B7C90DE|nr:phosphoribosylformylglycinamidine cyclo-ligase [Candidatus Entotheonella palauensis]
METSVPEPGTTYQAAGVDNERADLGLKRIISRVRQTWPQGNEPGALQLDIGHYASVIDAGGIGLAIATDGIGSKAIIAQMVDRYDTVGIDCVAMNVNDLICVGATPLSMVDYMAVQDPHPDLLDDLSKGLCAGAEMANISISGGETAQLPSVITGYKEGFGFDLAGTAVGTVPLGKIIVGRGIEPGDVVVGIESNGIHSNGLSLARYIFFEQHDYTVETRFPELRQPLGDELLEPTHIYVREALAVLSSDVALKALVHITGDGFLNLNRVDSEVGFVIDQLPPVPPIFSLMQQLGQVSDEEMFRVFNMGVGFCMIVPAHEAERVISIVNEHGKQAYAIGYAVADPEKHIHIVQKGIVGKGKTFLKSD